MKKLILLFLCIPMIALSQDFNPQKFGVNIKKNTPNGLELGSKAPLFEALDSEGYIIKLKDIIAQQTVILLFYRGQWCPVCDQYLRNLNDSLSYIMDKGARIIAIGPETAENAKMAKHKSGAEFTFVSDTDMCQLPILLISKVLLYISSLI